MWSTGVGFTLLTYHPGALLSQPAEPRALMKHGLFYLHCHHPSLFLFAQRCWRLPPTLVVWVTAITAQLRTEESAGKKGKRWSSLIFSLSWRETEGGGACCHCYSVVPGNQIWMTLMLLICVVWLPLLIIPFPLLKPTKVPLLHWSSPLGVAKY